MSLTQSTAGAGGGEPTAEQLLGYGYAPGGYVGTCKDCRTQQWDLDKRAIRCKECATKAWRRNRAIAALASAPPAGQGNGVWVPQAAMDWLNGAGPDHEGHFFGDYWQLGKSNFRWRTRFREMIAATSGASAPPAPTPDAGSDWRDDPSADERWNAGLDFGMQQFCAKLGVDPQEVCWDAATETLDGDVRSVIGNILTLWAGDNWRNAPGRLSASPPPGEDLAGQGEPVAMEDVAFYAWRCREGEGSRQRWASAIRHKDLYPGGYDDRSVTAAYEAATDILSLLAAPAPSRPADREEIKRIILDLPYAKAWPNRVADAADRILALRDAPRTGGDGWRPIETAPKDGQLIAVAAGCAYWCVERECWCSAVGMDHGRPISWSVTHWKSVNPITIPPSPNAGDGTQTPTHPDREGKGRER